MAEYYTVTDGKTVAFEGYFNPKELFQIVRRFLQERGYFPLEMYNYEEVYEHGRQVSIKLQPFKQMSDYLKQEMVLRIDMIRLKEEIIEVDGVKRQYSSGKVTLNCDALLQTDFKSKWEGTGWLYFLRTINDKFIRKDWINRSKTEVANDLDDLLEEVRSFLNMIRFKAPPREKIEELTSK